MVIRCSFATYCLFWRQILSKVLLGSHRVAVLLLFAIYILGNSAPLYFLRFFFNFHMYPSNMLYAFLSLHLFFMILILFKILSPGLPLKLICKENLYSSCRTLFKYHHLWQEFSVSFLSSLREPIFYFPFVFHHTTL